MHKYVSSYTTNTDLVQQCNGSFSNIETKVNINPIPQIIIVNLDMYTTHYLALQHLIILIFFNTFTTIICRVPSAEGAIKMQKSAFFQIFEHTVLSNNTKMILHLQLYMKLYLLYQAKKNVTSVQMTVVAFFKNHQSTIKELLYMH